MFQALTDLMSRSDPQAFFALFFVFGAGLLVAIVAIISYHVCQFRKRELDAALKQQMIARGMSADEIQQVLEVTTASSCKSKAADREPAV